MSQPQATLADYGSTGQQTLGAMDADELPTTFVDGDTPRRVGRYEAVTPDEGQTVARWEHDTGRREIVVCRVDGDGFEVQDIQTHEQPATTSLIDETPSKSAAMAKAVRFMQR